LIEFYPIAVAFWTMGMIPAFAYIGKERRGRREVARNLASWTIKLCVEEDTFPPG
jgi:hypothetical protein